MNFNGMLVCIYAKGRPLLNNLAYYPVNRNHFMPNLLVFLFT